MTETTLNPPPPASAIDSASGEPVGPLTGVEVVEIGTYVAVPSAAMTLAQLGADVIRIDPPGGAQDYRRWPVLQTGDSLYWTGLNRGIRSLCVDTRTAAGQALATELICRPGPAAGFLLTNAADQAWLSYDVLRRKRHDLVHVQVQGFADGRPAIDYTVNAAAGFPLVTGPEGWTGPVNHVLPAWDLLTGMMAALGLVAAERHRRISGEGRSVKVALADVAVATAANLGLLAEAQLVGTERVRQGNHVYGTFGLDLPTAEGRRLMIVPLTARQWRAFVDLTGTGPLIDAIEAAHGTDFDDEGARYRHREILAAVVRPWFETRTVEELSMLLERARIPFSPYRSFREIVADQLSGANPLPILAEVDQPGIGRVLASHLPIRFDPHPMDDPLTAPILGQDTDDVLRDVLGLSSADIARLYDAGVVSPPA